MPKRDLEICEVDTMSGMWMPQSIGCKALQEWELRPLGLGVGVSAVPFGFSNFANCSRSNEYTHNEEQYRKKKLSCTGRLDKLSMEMLYAGAGSQSR